MIIALAQELGELTARSGLSLPFLAGAGLELGMYLDGGRDPVSGSWTILC